MKRDGVYTYQLTDLHVRSIGVHGNGLLEFDGWCPAYPTVPARLARADWMHEHEFVINERGDLIHRVGTPP